MMCLCEIRWLLNILKPMSTYYIFLQKKIIILSVLEHRIF